MHFFQRCFIFRGRRFATGLHESQGLEELKTIRDNATFISQCLPLILFERAEKSGPKVLYTTHLFIAKMLLGHDKSICTMEIFTWLHLKKK